MKSLFTSARLKLTAWYLLIIMIISLVFSSVIYEGINTELKQIERLQQITEERVQLGLPVRLPPNIPLAIFEPNFLAKARMRLIMRLVLLNGGILLISGFAGYFLAGRTLRPIQEMVDEQNRFITDASHELRTPLTALRSEMEVELLNKKMTPDAKNLIRSNLEEVVALQSLSDNLLELAQFEKMKSVTPLEHISIAQVIKEAIKKVQPMAKQKHIEIHNKTSDLFVKGSKEKLRELFVILLDNSIKYSREKSNVTITSEISTHVALITITDEGMGINEKDAPFIFRRFYRADPSRTKSEVSGYGLGLSIAKKIVDFHQGKITFKSKLNKGTSMTLHLPIEKKVA